MLPALSTTFRKAPALNVRIKWQEFCLQDAVLAEQLGSRPREEESGFSFFWAPASDSISWVIRLVVLGIELRTLNMQDWHSTLESSHQPFSWP